MPEQATYAYIVVPGIGTAKDMKKYSRNSGIEILANTANHQVVRNKKAGIWQMVFYQAGEFSHNDLTVKVDKGCALLIKDTGKEAMKLHIADPSQSQTVVSVDVRKKKSSAALRCDFKDSGIYAGRTQAYDIRLK